MFPVIVVVSGLMMGREGRAEGPKKLRVSIKREGEGRGKGRDRKPTKTFIRLKNY